MVGGDVVVQGTSRGRDLSGSVGADARVRGRVRKLVDHDRVSWPASRGTRKQRDTETGGYELAHARRAVRLERDVRSESEVGGVVVQEVGQAAAAREADERLVADVDQGRDGALGRRGWGDQDELVGRDRARDEAVGDGQWREVRALGVVVGSDDHIELSADQAFEQVADESRSQLEADAGVGAAEPRQEIGQRQGADDGCRA